MVPLVVNWSWEPSAVFRQVCGQSYPRKKAVVGYGAARFRQRGERFRRQDAGDCMTTENSAFGCHAVSENGQDGVFARKLARRVEVRVLAHLDMRLGLLPLHVFQRSPLAAMPCLDPLLSPLEEGDEAFRIGL